MSSNLSRRRFLRTSATLAGLGGAALLAGCPERQDAPAKLTPTSGSGPGKGTTDSEAAATAGVDGKVGANRLVGHPNAGVEAVIARDRPRGELVRSAIDAYGGIEAFVSTGDRVVIKPNMGWAKPPAAGVDTHPEIVAAVIALCKEAGAKEVIVGEHSCDTWMMVKELSEIPEAVNQSGGVLLGWEDEGLYSTVDFPAGQSTTSDRVAKDVLECDVLINCPKFKHHSATEICGAMKNQLGMVFWPRAYHQTEDIMAKDPNLHVNIADLASAVRPTLNLVDLTNSCLTGGPKGGPGSRVEEFDTVIVSSDIVACDSLGTEILGICTVVDVPHIDIASAQRGLGNILTGDDRRVRVV